METAEPRRENPRRENEDPKWVKSITDKLLKLPTCVKPWTERQDPTRMRDRKLKELPMFAKLRMEVALPNLVIARKLSELPN
jgi:hypothetical protein